MWWNNYTVRLCVGSTSEAYNITSGGLYLQLTILAFSLSLFLYNPSTHSVCPGTSIKSSALILRPGHIRPPGFVVGCGRALASRLRRNPCSIFH